MRFKHCQTGSALEKKQRKEVHVNENSGSTKGEKEQPEGLMVVDRKKEATKNEEKRKRSTKSKEE